MKAKKLRKVLLSLVLSAAMMTEPLVSMSIVCAAEAQAVENTAGESEDSDNISRGDSDTVEENDGQDKSEGSDADTDSEKEGSEEETGGQKEDGDEETDEDQKADNSEEENNDSEEIIDAEITDGEEIPEEETAGAEIPDEVKEKDTEEKEEDEALDGFSDMPSGYTLTSDMEELKEELSDSLNSVSESDEGDIYAEREVITLADSLEEAELIADAYHAEILDYNMGVLTLGLSEDKSVKSTMTVASDMDNSLPPVWPNYYRELFEEADPVIENDASSEFEIVEEEYYIDNSEVTQKSDEDGISSLTEYEQVLNGYSDPYLQPANSSYQWFHTTIGSPYAWDAGHTGSGVKVGVIDSGIDSNTDLNNNVFGEKDFCDGSSPVTDSIGHGTHVAGIIAALENGTQGVGVAPKAEIFDARVFGTSNNSGTDATILAAINYLIGEEDPENPTSPIVDIINMSLGGPGYSSLLQYAMDKAYQKGVIVFASTGNDGGSLMMYPASFNHVIAVAATDTNNQRAYFSNYGSSTDLAAPGVNIYSTLNSGYASKQGTSMACPVATGEAAVILSGQSALSALNGKTGKARVDAVESIMKNNTISAGSGMGKGITSLPKVFKLSTAAAKPNAPVITITPVGDKQSVEVTIQAQAGMKLCYTINGKNPVYKNEETDANTTFVDGNKTTFFLNCSQTAKGTVKAFAINASGVISAVKSQTYTLSPYVTDITVSGPVKVEKGKTISLAATITPTYASNKKVTWQLQTSKGETVDPAKIKIDQKGKVTTTAKADVDTYKVIVTAQDGSGKSADYEIQVVEAGTAIQSLAFDKSVNKELWITKKIANPTSELAPSLVAKEKNAEGTLVEIESSKLGDYVVWTSSKPAVATVNAQTGKVTAKAAGTTTITAKAKDNSNKKVTINITVKQAVTGITITNDKGNEAASFTLAAGKSMTLKAKLNPAKPSNKGVVWSINSDDPKVTINKSTGKITTKAGASGSYTVTATAADGKGVTSTQTMTVCGGAIGEIKLDTTKTTLYTQKIDEDRTNTRVITATIKGAKGASDFDPNAYTVTNSNEDIVTAAVKSDSNGTVTITLTTTGLKYGKANIVIASTDGSNKKAACAVTVSGGIRGVEIRNADKTKRVSSLALFRTGTTAVAPKTATLYAVITGTDGANLGAYDVTSSNPALVKATLDKNTGKIVLTTSEKSTGKATITLMATDGSKKKATCTVVVNNPPSRINIAPKNGTTKYVVPGKSVQLTATMETEYGAVVNKNVLWSVSETYKAKGISVSTSGKVTLAKNASVTGSIPITATAKDGSGVSARYSVYVTTPTTYITETRVDYTYSKYGIYIVSFATDCKTSMSCTSSSPAVASPTISYKGTGTGTIKFQANKKGTTTFTIKALDSTNKTYKMRFVFR
ncbi:MAG: S8 family serine peptidase [Lachnospiraceae bacterium]|nr:S8 family serine peptidase [Lachnospiraceae bacterium]